MLSQIPDSDWRDGFLFLGNHLSLDFLNTRPVIDGNPVEFLADPASFARWWTAAGLAGDIGGRELDELRRFREEYRAAILGVESGAGFDRGWQARLNARLADHPYTDGVAGEGFPYRRERRFVSGDPWGPILDSVADLMVAVADPTRIRKCSACVLHFLDTSKKGTRRWCSMRMCGNRYKVAAYAKRKRNQEGDLGD